MRLEHYEAYHRLELKHWWARARRRIFAEAIERWAPGHRPFRVVDIGCATGANLAEWERFGQVNGVDASLLALGYCARQGRHQLVGGSLLSLPLRDGSIDVVLALDDLSQNLAM